MRVPISWLRDFVAIPEGETGRDIAARLISAGLEVETVDRMGGDVSGPLVVGQVSVIEELTEFKKPIRFCRVVVGPEHGEVLDGVATDERGVICGARNFAVGDLVVVALPGVVLPGGFQIAQRKTYGRVSDGMITSERELGLGEDHSGIIVLAPGSAAVGQAAGPILGVGEEVLDIAVTPDRGYALSIRGVAREVATSYGLTFSDPALLDPQSLLPAPLGGAHECAIADPSAADRFVLRTVTGLDPTAESPQWMRQRLVAAGMRPVSLAVDVTNYVMLELGQPLHAFDRSKLAGPLQVRRAQPGETLVTLDHVTRTLDPADVVIADARHALALAGTMGGLESEIDEDSSELAIEAVHFNAIAVARMSRRHKLSSEASKRFERGVDSALPAVASARAAALLVELGGARYIGASEVGQPSAPAPIAISAGLPARVSGVSIAPNLAVTRLEQVGCAVAQVADELQVTPPTWRPDLTDPFDLVEEVVRLGGYESLPATLPRARAGYGLTTSQRQRRRVGRTLAGCGFNEVLSYPFVSASDLDSLMVPPGDERRALVALANPLSEEAPYLRTSLLPGLLEALKRNVSRGQPDLALFEAGLVFRGVGIGTSANPPRPAVSGRPTDAQVAELEALLPSQRLMLAGTLSGSREAPGWWGPGQPAGWADAIQAVRDLAAELNVEIEVAAGDAAPWHPGRCACITVAGVTIGWAGELHPRVIAALGLPKRMAAFEFELDSLLAAAPEAVAAPEFSNYPVAKEDLALVVDRSVTSAALQSAAAEGAGEILESIRLFDLYEGAQVGSAKSLAFSLRLRAPDRTLTPAEVAAAREGAIASAAERCGASLRD